VSKHTEAGTRRRVHPALAWLLLAALIASAWALWWPSADTVQPDQRWPTVLATATTPLSSVAEPPPAPGPSAGGMELAGGNGELAAVLSPATRDPFYPTPAMPPTKDHPGATQGDVKEPEPPPSPPPPPMNHRVIGRFQTPGGQWLVLVQDGAAAVQVEPALLLSSGWVVESVTTREVTLRHPLVKQASILAAPEDNPS
jgi:hypothetical protein